ncbi:hypothetical protein AKUA1202_05410 [Apilactobacillus kunkeei]|nr:hypothetical protein AKUA1802_05270 [Apilactobacillus kunkeei]CAI2584784.1 hypothetical protein AKUA0901_05270 [Apilactobacillus kunkeei]CAI2585057.1 hypothetical protein AKUA1201_05270 [Apilactobacillus kunkeei]CAI2585114.1 hypothetical protein AKUA1002_05270 [Apilactobacillus kunkeei]CAI2652836.1 hypothetical protein AKUA1803_05270 [Apilactobacillus kunkeei]
MKYNGAVVTSNGSSFLSGLVANKKSAVLDKIIILNTDVPSNKTIDSMTAQDFSNGMSFDINNVSQNDNSFTATSVISNTGNTNNYPAMLVGLFGYYDGSSERTLLSVSKAVDPFVIEKDTGTPVKLSVSITVGFSSSQQVNLTVKDDVYLAKKDIDGTMINLGFAKKNDLSNLGINLTNTFNQKLNDVNGTLNRTLRFVKNLTSDDDLNSLITTDYYSMYQLNGQIPKNAPADLKNPYGVVIVIGNMQQTQYIITDSVYFRTATNTWKNDWKTLATTDAINQINSSISILSQAISDASTIASKANGLASQAQATAYNGLQYRGFWTGRKYWDWNGQPDGIYSIDINQQPRDGMIPREFTGWGILILITNISNQDRYCTLQDNNNHMFRNHQFVGSGGFSGWIQY